LDERALLAIVREVIGREQTLDDCAVMPFRDFWLVATTDMLHLTTDFPREMSDWQIGWMSAAVSLSDIAAMGACPWFMLLATGLDRPERLRGILNGARDCCVRYGAELVGGDLDHHDELTIVSTVIGKVERERVVKRSGSKIGDSLCVTGTLGCAGAALAGYHEFDHNLFEPQPRVEEGRKLGAAGVTSMMDISDGLALSLYDLSEANTCGYAVSSSRIPVPPGVPAEVAEECALYSGGDFELLFTCPPGRLQQIDIPFSVIGEVIPGPQVIIDGRVIEKRGFVHMWRDQGQ
jgi:thiamine-monophosphate kinase